MATKRAKAKRQGISERAHEFLRGVALDYPESVEEHPWGECAIKVRKKIFAFVNRTDEGGCGLTVKLPASQPEALLLPFSEPTHYGMGKHGWVTCRFAPDEEPPMELLVEWIDESFRAIAPKKLVALLDGEVAPTPKKKSAVKKKKAVTKKPTAKKAPGGQSRH